MKYSTDSVPPFLRFASDAVMRAFFLISDLFLSELLLRLKRKCAHLPPTETYRLGKRLGLMFYAFRTMANAAVFRGEFMQRVITKAFGAKLTKPQACSIAKRAYKHFGVNVTEALASLNWPQKKFGEIIKIEGLNHVRDAYRYNRGLIFLTAHYGAWELIGQLPWALYRQDIYVVMRDQPLKRINRHLKAFRRHRIRFLYPSHPKTYWHLRDSLESGKLVGLISDHFYCPMQITKVPFFGKPAKTQVFPATLSRTTGAPILPVFIQRSTQDFSRHGIRIYPPIFPDKSLPSKPDAKRILSYYRKCLEEMITEDPTQYLWTFDPWL